MQQCMPDTGSWGPVRGEKYCARTAARNICSPLTPLVTFFGHTLLQLLNASPQRQFSEQPASVGILC